MTHGDIALLLETKIQTAGYFLSETLEPEEINLALDNGLNDLIDEVLSGLRKPEVNGGSFESNSVRLDELRRLKKTSGPLTKVASPPTGTEWFDLPDDYRDYIRLVPEVTADCFGETPVQKKARVADSETLPELLDDTYHKTKPKSPIAEIEDTKALIYVDDFSVNNLRVTYIKKPINFDVEGKKDEEYPLPEKVVYRVLDKVAVMLAPVLEKLQQQAQAIQSNKLT